MNTIFGYKRVAVGFFPFIKEERRFKMKAGNLI